MRAGSCALCIHTWHASYIIIFHTGTERPFLSINVKAPSADRPEVLAFLESRQGSLMDPLSLREGAGLVVPCHIELFLPNSTAFS